MAEAGFPAGRRQPRDRLRRRGRRRDRREPGRHGHLVHRQLGDRQGDRHERAASGSSASRSSSAARTPWSCWPTRTSTSPTDGILWSRLRHDRPALHGLLAGHRRARGRRAAAPAARGAGEEAPARVPASTRRPTSGRSSTPARSTRSIVHRRRAIARASSSLGGAPRDRRRPRARPLLRADDLQRRQADGPHRPGGDLRAGPVGHPGRRLRRGDAGAQPDPLRPVVEHLHRAT